MTSDERIREPPFSSISNATWLNGNRYKGKITSLASYPSTFMYRVISIFDREIQELDGNSRIDYPLIIIFLKFFQINSFKSLLQRFFRPFIRYQSFQ